MATTTIFSSAAEQATCAAAGRTFRWRDLAPAAALSIVGLSALLLASLSSAASNGQYVVVAAPWSSLGQTIRLVGAADGDLVQAGRFANVVIAASDLPDFPTAARNAGAWLVFASPRLAGCIGARPKSTLP